MRGARRKEREADRVLERLGYRYASDDRAVHSSPPGRSSDAPPPGAPRAGGQTETAGTGPAAESTSPVPDNEVNP